MMHKKQGITGRHGQSVACKFKNLRLNRVQGRNKLLITPMLSHAHCCWLQATPHHPRAGPKEWERRLQPQPHCTKKTNVPHMKHSLHTDKTPARPHPPGLNPIQKTRAKSIGEIRRKAKEKFLTKAKVTEYVTLSRLDIPSFRPLRHQIRPCLRGTGKLGWEFSLASPTKPSAASRALSGWRC